MHLYFLQNTTALKTAAALSLLLTLTGCLSLRPQADTTQLYVLGHLGSAGSVQHAPSSPSAATQNLGIAPVQVPEYLKRSEIVMRGPKQQIILPPRMQWAEPIQAGIAQNLARNLGAQAFPWPAIYTQQPGFKELHVDVEQFEYTQPTGAVQLRANWLISNPRTSAVLQRGSANISVPTKQSNALLGMRTALEQLAQQINNKLPELPKTPKLQKKQGLY